MICDSDLFTINFAVWRFNIIVFNGKLVLCNVLKFSSYLPDLILLRHVLTSFFAYFELLTESKLMNIYNEYEKSDSHLMISIFAHAFFRINSFNSCTNIDFFITRLVSKINKIIILNDFCSIKNLNKTISMIVFCVKN